MSTQQVHMERMFARVFIAFGAVFWLLLSIHGEHAIVKEVAGLPWEMVFTIIYILGIFALTFYNEVMAAHVLLASAAVASIYGIFAHWELGVWMIMATFFLFPSLAAAMLLVISNNAKQDSQ